LTVLLAAAQTPLLLSAPTPLLLLLLLLPQARLGNVRSMNSSRSCSSTL
jgi:hypothetical protein